jgi:hypothetical protein
VQALTGHDLEVDVNPAFVRANEVKTCVVTNSKLRDWSRMGNPPLSETLSWMLTAE